MAKYKALFVEESREHLAEVSRLLLALEGGADPSHLVDDLFRHLHSLKGMAASMAYEPAATLAHRMEDVVEAWRRETAAPTRDCVDVLLRGVDALGQQIFAVAEDEPLSAHRELEQELLAVNKQTVPPAQAATDAKREGSQPPPEPDAQGRASTPRCKRVKVRLLDTCSAPAIRGFLVLRRVEAVAEILVSDPSVEQLRRGEMPTDTITLLVSGQVADAVLQGALDKVSEIGSVEIEAAESVTETAKAADTYPQRVEAPVRPDTNKGLATLRVRTEVLDSLMDSVGELYIDYERLRIVLGDVARPDVRAAIDPLGARVREIHDRVMTARMMPMRILTDRYPRLVRDLSRTLGKQVELEMRGGEIEMDRAVLDHLDAPLVHTLRNAIDHGIELPEERVRLGKPATGKVILDASRDRDMVLVVVADDGKGMDPQELNRVAVQRGLITEAQASSMATRDSYFLVCVPGFSTKTDVSDTSGRGVGMDVVRAKIEGLGGSLDIETEPQRGTRFVFRLPLTLVISPVLVIESAERTFAVPVAKIVAVRELEGEIVRRSRGQCYLEVRQAMVPVHDLATVLGLSSSERADHAVVVEDGRDLLAVAVDKMVGYHEVVVKPLGDPLDRLEYFAGATVLGDGRPILILDVPKILRLRASS